MREILQKYSVLLAAIYAIIMGLLPFGLYFAPLIYVLILIAIYLRELHATAQLRRLEALQHQRTVEKLLRQIAAERQPAPPAAAPNPAADPEVQP